MARVLTINGGSSSIKFALFDSPESPRRLVVGKVDRIGQKDAALDIKPADQPGESSVIAAPDHRTAVGAVLNALRKRKFLDDPIAAVGHRIVHGGPKFSRPTRVTSEVMDELRRIAPLALEHLPPAISLLEVLLDYFSDLPHILCFDTAFHSRMPRVAKILPIPRRFEAMGVQRYGFHGLSYEYLIAELARLAGEEAARGRVIIAHFGNGASIAAVKGGVGIDTSMGFTPAAGIVMGRRTGDIDPGIVYFLARTANMTPEAFHKMTNQESGMLGVSGGLSNDMRDLLSREAAGDEQCADAVNLFCYEAKKRIGSYAAALGGLDTLVFAGGIGENASEVRRRVCEGLEFLGITIDPTRNASGAPIISSDSSRTIVRVIPTDEEIVIARAVYAAIV